MNAYGPKLFAQTPPGTQAPTSFDQDSLRGSKANPRCSVISTMSQKNKGSLESTWAIDLTETGDARGLRAVDLSSDQRPMREDERSRILQQARRRRRWVGSPLVPLEASLAWGTMQSWPNSADLIATFRGRRKV